MSCLENVLPSRASRLQGQSSSSPPAAPQYVNSSKSGLIFVPTLRLVLKTLDHPEPVACQVSLLPLLLQVFQMSSITYHGFVIIPKPSGLENASITILDLLPAR